jgi:asparagine synthase (glutamine-hydrolysing)
LLSGVGGDELFAGYRKYQAHYWALSYQRIPKPLRTYLIEPSIRAMPSLRGSSLKGYMRLAKKMARSGSLPPAERFLMDSVYLLERQKEQLYSDEYRTLTDGFDPFSAHRRHLEKVKHADFLNQMMYLDLKTFTVSLNLTYNDKMSMASSVEVRVPFLDPHFAGWAFNEIPPGLKLHNGVPKYILRESMKPLVPEEVFRQKKAGFGAPIDHWLVNDLRQMTDDLLSESQIKRRGLFDPRAVHSLIQEHRSGRNDWSMQIWQFITLELWFRQFIDQKPS